MQKNDYIKSPAVVDFMAWIEPLLDTQNSFKHGYIQKKPKAEFVCDNLYSAYEKYEWLLSGLTGEITDLSKRLIKSLEESDEQACVRTCVDILRWGGVLNGNKTRVEKLAPHLCDELRFVSNRLALDLSSDEFYIRRINMTAGFSKIYSAYIDNFLIYDSRVGASIGLLVREFCTQRNINNIPMELLFCWNSGKSGNVMTRNPSNSEYKFPQWGADPAKHMENNIRANWLFSEIASTTKSKFTSIEESFRLRALEQALFMIGYDVSGAEDKKSI